MAKKELTIDEVFSFIDGANIEKAEVWDLKSRIVHMVQAERDKAIEEFAEVVSEKIMEYSCERCKNMLGSVAVEKYCDKKDCRAMDICEIIRSNKKIHDEDKRFEEMAKLLGGEVVKLNPGSGTYINPLLVDPQE